MWTRAQLKTSAKATLKLNYWGSVVAALISTLFLSSAASSAGSGISDSDIDISGLDQLDASELAALFAVFFGVIAVVGIIGLIANIFVGNPLRVGVNHFFLACKGQEKTSVGEVLFGFKNSYGNVVKTMFLRDLFIGFWSLLLIIPGIYKSFQWFLVPYIMADDPSMDAKAARELSTRMMDGHKWNTFVLQLSFLGWGILGVCTLGIALVFWVNPYYEHTFAELYRTLKDSQGEHFLHAAQE